MKSLLHGSAKNKTVVWHREHRSKRNRRFKERMAPMYKKKKEDMLIKALEEETWMILNK
jgi:hypothetical protein